MVVAIVGCLCPVFTLLLLHCLNAARVTRFGTALTLTSWLLNTVVFFMLLPNLSTFGDNVAEDALKQLFSVPTCGDSSAMSLCQQLTGDNPLQSLTGFFERSSWTNIRTIPVVWALTTVILLVMVADGARHIDVDRLLHGKQTPGPKEEETNYSRLDETQQQESDSSSQEEQSPRTGRLIVAVVFIMLCSVGLGYSFHMVTRFRDVNAIDTHGWSFGQVVAAVFWVPVFLDVAHSMISG
ncbi:hypothetical protein B0T24DRAFT_199441 [Lasiosphaeria ovina]|uniref:Transmembrane protein n=1 Tax=Lasiosphaeria ovina TaxID=92902 RepID=A0AAE0NFP7_9PEZI|nr:hypothetical protein B0T24DRAFT_199441 [Lasiosphaeria ovina]